MFYIFTTILYTCAIRQRNTLKKLIKFKNSLLISYFIEIFLFLNFKKPVAYSMFNTLKQDKYALISLLQYDLVELFAAFF